MIPKTIHYCWFGKKEKHALAKKCIASWKQFLPDYRIKEWNETNSPMEHPYVQAAYQSKLWSKASNFVRLNVLYNEGGIYFDTDVEVIKSFDPLLNQKCFVGFQQEKRSAHWVNNAVVGAVPQHPFIKKCMELTIETFEKDHQFIISPKVSTSVLEQMGLREYGQQNIGGVTIYPFDYFYPYLWEEAYHPKRITEHTYCVHHWEMSWRKWGKYKDRLNAKITKFKGHLRECFPRMFKRLKTIKMKLSGK